MVSVAYLLAAALAVRRFARAVPPRLGSAPPAVTVLKPLCGSDPGLYDNLRSFCAQDYPCYQVVFGVRDADDPALPVVRRLMADLPEADLALVVEGGPCGTNRKVGNLSNMMRAARHDLLVIADSDMRVGADYLARVVAPFADPGVGLVTCLYVGRPAGGLWSQLGAMFINHGFLPSVLVGRLVGSRDGCFGATMALARDTLEQIGGFAALRDQLADDYALGAAVSALGRKVELSSEIVENQVLEPSFGSLWRHEMRWARTIRGIAPLGFAASAVTHGVALAALAVVIGGFPTFALAALAVALAARLLMVATVDRALGAVPSPLWLVPMRDLLSFAVLIASFCVNSVQWRGESFRVQPDGRLLATGD